MVEQQPMELLAAHAFQVLGAGLDQQIGRGDAGKTVRRAGAAQQAVEQRLLQFLVPLDAFLDQGAHQGDSAPSHAGFVPRRAENGTGHLAKPAAIAAGDLVVPFFDAHLSPAWQAARSQDPVRVQGRLDLVHECPIGRGVPKHVVRSAECVRRLLEHHGALQSGRRGAPAASRRRPPDPAEPAVIRPQPKSTSRPAPRVNPAGRESNATTRFGGRSTRNTKGARYSVSKKAWQTPSCAGYSQGDWTLKPCCASPARQPSTWASTVSRNPSKPAISCQADRRPSLRDRNPRHGVTRHGGSAGPARDDEVRFQLRLQQPGRGRSALFQRAAAAHGHNSTAARTGCETSAR